VSENLAPIREQVYLDPRPAEYFTPFHEWARERGTDWVYEACRLVLSPYCWILFRLRGIASERVPATGPVILTPNHFSFLDHFFLGVALRRKIRFMAKSQLFKRPLQIIFKHGGVFPVRRGHADEEAFKTSFAILDQGGCLAMYPEGGRSRSGQVGTRAKRGIGRLALQSGVPVVPVAIHGSSRTRNWKRLQFPKVTVLYGQPVRWEAVEHPTREQEQQVADEILTEIRALYAELDTLGRRGMVRRAREWRRAGTAVPSGASRGA
jgi:1-acyl-sn-glycerol-3-phosphate acyltransferase